jgi:hypothetical protein
MSRAADSRERRESPFRQRLCGGLRSVELPVDPTTTPLIGLLRLANAPETLLPAKDDEAFNTRQAFTY